MAFSSHFGNGPTLFAQPPPHAFRAFPAAAHSFQGPHSSAWAPLDDGAPPPLPAAHPVRPPLTSNPSRKRSRDVFADDDDNGGGNGDALAALRADVGAPSPLDLGAMMAMDAPTPPADSPAAAELAALRPLKSARRSFAATPSTLPALSSAGSTAPTPLSSALGTPSPTTAPTMAAMLADEPTLLTPAALALGVGWKELGPADADAPAVRGWTRFLAKHYPALGEGVRIVLRHDGAEQFVVQGGGGWWLFREDLGEGRLIARAWEECVARLRVGPVVCEAETLVPSAGGNGVAPEPVAVSMDDPMLAAAAPAAMIGAVEVGEGATMDLD